jgi:hypothetical protein
MKAKMRAPGGQADTSPSSSTVPTTPAPPDHHGSGFHQHVPSTPFPFYGAYGMPPAPPFFPPYPSPYGYASPWAPHHKLQQLSPRHGHHSCYDNHHSSSPSRHRSSSPPIPECELHEFCQTYGLDDQAEQVLRDLGFQVGDELHDVPDTEWTKLNVSFLARQRILKAYKKFKRDARK